MNLVLWPNGRPQASRSSPAPRPPALSRTRRLYRAPHPTPKPTTISATVTTTVEPASHPALDPTFDQDGLVTTDFGAQDVGLDVVVQPDAKIVAAGYRYGGTGVFDEPGLPLDFALARYNPDGGLDSTFGLGGGRVVTDFADGADDWATSALLQPDGKIVVAGTSGGRFALARYGVDGSLDPTFGSAGLVTTAASPGLADWSVVQDVALQSDGKVIAAGYTAACPFVSVLFFPIGACQGTVTLARYLPDGQLDRTFGTGGLAYTCCGLATSVLIQRDGSLDKIVIGGGWTGRVDGGDFLIARYLPNGNLDPTFGSAGVTTTEFEGRCARGHDVTLLPDGRLAATGAIMDDFCNESGLAVVRYSANGILDTTFGDGGKVVTDDFGREQGNSIVAAGEKVIVGGSWRSRFALFQYNADGSLDPGFGSGGIAVAPFSGSAAAYGIALRPDGSLVSLGWDEDHAGAGNNFNFALARFLVQ